MLFSRKFIAIAAAVLLCFLPLAGADAEGDGHDAAVAAADAHAAGHANDAALPEHADAADADAPHEAPAAAKGVSPKPYILFEIPFGDPADADTFTIPVTNSMVMSWAISLLLIVAVRMMVGRPKIIPGRGQAIIETLLKGIRDIMEPIVGHRMLKHTFPLLICFFVFILIQNWSGLLPGVGAFGFYDDHGHLRYWMRPGNADLNMTFALSLVHLVAWVYFVMRYAGPRLVLYDIFGNKADRREVPLPIYIFLFFIFLGVGVVEVISIVFRNISLPFRLYGNVFGGETLLTSMTGLVGWVVPVPFYFLEVLIGFVQALVFTLLVAVYIGLICNHDDGHDEAHAH